MILTVPLQPGTLLANVRYRWIANGVAGSTLSAGITQPDVTFAEFRFDVSPPAGAEELIAFDNTDAGNWNPAGYLKKAAAEVIPAPSQVRQPFLRTVTFRSVLDAIVRRHGLEPDWTESPTGRSHAITEHINERVRTAWDYWDWPETLALEERAFRPAWDNTVAYSAGAEVFYNSNYYQAIAGTTPGQAPTDVSAWTPFSVADRFIGLDAAGATSIGQVFGVYTSNPRTDVSSQMSAVSLLYRLSENGLDVGYGAGATVWIHFRVAPPEFSAVPFATGHSYKAGDVRYFGATEECYKALVDTTNDPTTVDWQKQSMPEFLAGYVKAGAYADGLLESDPTEQGASARPDLLGQLRIAKANIANNEAEGFLTAEIDQLIAQGEVHYHGFWSGCRSRYRPLQTVLVSVTA